jgi:hypothetical protein
MMSAEIRVRFESRYGAKEFRVPGAILSTAIALHDADALLCDWAPTRSLVRFDGPRAWYCGEPVANPRICAGRWQRAWKWAFRTLEPHQMLHFSNPDPRYAVPAVTHWSEVIPMLEGERLNRAVSVVSNAGGYRPWPEAVLRNRFVTAGGVDLFGRRSGWRGVGRHGWLPIDRSLPPSYAGEIPGHWYTTEKTALMARYSVAVCLENSYLPHYFTEKFVDAARAGCIPVYRAHPSVREGILQGARWVDPAEFDLDPGKTLAYALAQDRDEYAHANARWLQGPTVSATHGMAVYARVAAILRSQF